MERKKVNYILSVIALVLITFSIWLLVSRPLEIRELKVEFIVGENPGFNLDSDKLNFGRLTLGGSAVRGISIKNEQEIPIKLKVFASKNIADFISVESGQILLPGQNISVPVTLNIPKDMPLGNYSGKIKFEFRKA